MKTLSLLKADVCRRAWKLAYLNGGLWAVGNGLTSSTLVIYLALQLGAPRVGLGISLILAARHLVGVLRLGTPILIRRIGDRKTFCLGAFLLSALLLFCLPFVAAPGVLSSAGMSLAALVAIWTLHHLMQYLGTIALYSWFADIAPLSVRGRFFGFRERWMVAGEAAAAIACGLFTQWWNAGHDKPQQWIGYAISAGLGAWFMLAAIVPLGLMPRAEAVLRQRCAIDWRSVAKPFTDNRFVRLLLFGCWFSFSNGLTQTVQTTYPAQVLGVGLLMMLAVQTGMHLRQLSISPALGRMADRVGNLPVMMCCLILTTQDPLFYFFSTSQAPWWFVGAWIVWIAYVGMNVALPNLMLKLAPGESNTPFIAAYFTVTGLCYAANTILGGWLFDRYGTSSFEFFGGAMNYNQWIFLLGWIARCLGILALLVVIEPRNKQVGSRPSLAA